MAKTQRYGIEFPIKVRSYARTLFDLNASRADLVKSEIMHCLFTPKGQRLRSPNFGSRLIQFIYDPSDQDSWGEIVSEARDMITSWVPYCNLQDIEITETDDGLGIMLVVKYTVRMEDGSTQAFEMSANI